MPKPVLKGCGANLKKKKSGKSKFWIVGTDIFVGDCVIIKKGESHWWRGKIKKSHGHKHLAKVKYMGSINDEEPKDDADLEEVDITVANADPSDAITDEVVIDAP